MDKIDFTTCSREDLIERIKALEMLNHELLKEKEADTRLEYAWTGNLGHWYWNIKTNEVEFNPLKVTTLGYDLDEIPRNVSYQYFTDKLHPEDYAKTMKSMLDHLYAKSDVYETEYRIRTKNGKYKWYYDRGKITQYDDKGKPLFLAGIVFDITEKKQIEKELEEKNSILLELSSTDGLTKLYNHRTLMNYLQAAIAESNRTKTPLSIAIFDIDEFKKVNDTKGHLYGDEVLVEVARLIKVNIRETDIAGRYGGEEFMVIFSGANIKVASNISERIRKSISNHPFTEATIITISGGVQQYKGGTMTELLKKADENLYKAKNNGKNQIIIK